MRPIFSSLIAVVIGFFSIGLLVFFYHHQNQFSTHYKQVLSDLQNIVEIEHVLTYNILQNTLYLYSNQDSIANNRNRLAQVLQE
ncbi:MAG: hypothetical protein U9R50_00495, partial [Campylobacterota bacterium]|nr:hypothetical protein [Campylobacterota bacterium]